MKRITNKIVSLITGIIAWFKVITPDSVKIFFIRVVQEFVAGCKLAAICLMILKTFTCWISFEEYKISKHTLSALRNENPDLIIPSFLRHPVEVRNPAVIELERREAVKKRHTSTKTENASKENKKSKEEKKVIKIRVTPKPEDYIDIKSIKTTDSIDIKEMLKKHLADTIKKEKGFIKARKIPDTTQIPHK